MNRWPLIEKKSGRSSSFTSFSHPHSALLSSPHLHSSLFLPSFLVLMIPIVCIVYRSVKYLQVLIPTSTLLFNSVLPLFLVLPPTSSLYSILLPNLSFLSRSLFYFSCLYLHQRAYYPQLYLFLYSPKPRQS